ncbi:hypothetical protein AES38_11845 [Clavibacter capsici]|nr:hypothetical protein AES38_11845 [Clavibacter capsici]
MVHASDADRARQIVVSALLGPADRAGRLLGRGHAQKACQNDMLNPSVAATTKALSADSWPTRWVAIGNQW